MMGTHRYLSVFLSPMICSVAVLVVTNSEPYVAVSAAACLFEYQSIQVVLMKCYTAVNGFPVTISWSNLASKKWWLSLYSLVAWECLQVFDDLIRFLRSYRQIISIYSSILIFGFHLS